ncbi:leucine rich adaptor protein 1-like [Mugil cephalus]|uniref:leucine rich adaptor protein 1-like n=1 Tax=Mugil cephalus TaxID=48193 RepID=UPI001FB6110C|nr:leucine rich adaptor protein 1-like [Mugil cephalus]
MADELLDEDFPDLKELENKIGRKTPESLVIWLRDAANCEDGWKSDVNSRGDNGSAFPDSFCDKINNLKQEMRWLRSTDVRILRQLVAVNEGIETMRWLMEERGALASRGSSLTGSLSSLATSEECGQSVSPREYPSPTGLEDLAETTSEESADQTPPPHTDRGGSHQDSSTKAYEPRPLSPSTSRFIDDHSTRDSHDLASINPANGLDDADVPKSQSQDSDVAAHRRVIKTRGNTIWRALLRSNRPRRQLKEVIDSFALTHSQQGDTSTVCKAEESFTASHTNTTEEEESAPGGEALLGYDAQWCWVNSQDDVTFL